MNPFDHLSGEGRLLLTASTATEPAREMNRTSHGLLTFYLLEALQGAEEVGMRAVLIRVPHDEWEHEGTIGWTGARVSSLSEVLALV